MLKAKRSACDRCHAMKMQCKADGHGGHCARCQNANVPCNYSEPGRPGRPVTRSGNAVDPIRTAATDLAVPSIPTPTSSRTPADEGTWGQSEPTVYDAVENYTCTRENHTGTCARNGLLNPFPGSEYLHLDTAERFGPSDWLWSTSEAEAPPASTVDDNRQIRPSSPDEMRTAAYPAFLSAISKATTTSPIDRNAMEQLAHFQLKLARKMSSTTHLGFAELEQEAAHVLQSSSEFLELIRTLKSVAHDHKGSNRPSPIDMASFLQLTSMTIRLTEIHHWLYSSIHRCLQRRDADILMGQEHTTHESYQAPSRPPPLSIAGVELTPSPQFRLQMLLHTGVHYLDQIQRTQGGLKALAFDGTSGISSTMAMQIHMLITEDQKSLIANIQLLLSELQWKFGLIMTL